MTPPDTQDARGYWKATIRLTVSLLVVWFLVSFGAGILFREALDAYSIGGAPLGFWFAQNGAIYVFLALIVVYCIRMTGLERKFNIGQGASRQDASRQDEARQDAPTRNANGEG